MLVFSLTVHESAHAWAADRLGDPTARLLGRVSLNPIVHVDPIGTVLFPLIGMFTGAPLIGWAKPVPVATWRFEQPRRDYLMVAAAGPLSNLALAFVGVVVLRRLGPDGRRRPRLEPASAPIRLLAWGAVVHQPAPGDLQPAADPAARRRHACWPACCPSAWPPASIAFARTASCCSTR